MVGTCGRYRLIEQTSCDALAEYFLARRIGAGDREPNVVVKRLLPQYVRGSPDIVLLLRDEVRISRLVRHPNVLVAIDQGEDEKDGPFLVLEHLEGIDLQSVLHQCHHRRISIPVEFSLRIFAEVLRALQHVHGLADSETGRPLAIVHRDICPANIRLGFEGVVKISNFDIARAQGNLSVTGPGTLKGRYSYMSPEQARGGPLDHRSDLFSCGTVLYELVCGVRPFRSRTHNELEILEKVKSARHEPALEVNPELTLKIGELLERALRHDPADRFADAGEMLERLVDSANELARRPSLDEIAGWAMFVRAAAGSPAPAEDAREHLAEGRFGKHEEDGRTRMARPDEVPVPGVGVILSDSESDDREKLATYVRRTRPRVLRKRRARIGKRRRASAPTELLAQFDTPDDFLQNCFLRIDGRPGVFAPPGTGPLYSEVALLLEFAAPAAKFQLTGRVVGLERDSPAVAIVFLDGARAGDREALLAFLGVP